MLLTVAVARNIIYWKGFRFSVFFTVLSPRSKQFSSFCFLEVVMSPFGCIGLWMISLILILVEFHTTNI